MPYLDIIIPYPDITMPYPGISQNKENKGGDAKNQKVYHFPSHNKFHGVENMDLDTQTFKVILVNNL